VASEGRWLVVGGDDSSLVLSRALSPVWRAFLYREAVVACAVSDAFKVAVAVAAMGDGAIVICSLVNASIVHIVGIAPQVPQAIAVTPAWGFIVFYATDVVPGSVRHWMTAMTNDGAIISRVEIHSKVSALLLAVACWLRLPRICMRCLRYIPR
jgi:hypothetical protein